MAVPKKKTSSSRSRMRRSHDSIESDQYVFDKRTGDPRRSHHIGDDGYYNGRQVFVPKSMRQKNNSESQEDLDNNPAQE
jgi:large subunit ribosomal protein L32